MSFKSEEIYCDACGVSSVCDGSVRKRPCGCTLCDECMPCMEHGDDYSEEDLDGFEIVDEDDFEDEDYEPGEEWE